MENTAVVHYRIIVRNSKMECACKRMSWKDSNEFITKYGLIRLLQAVTQDLIDPA